MNVTMCNTTIVIFRKVRTGHEDCFALFPELPADIDGMCCTAYQHFGQHCSADYQGCIANSDPASAADFTDLFEELDLKQANFSS